MTRREEKEKKLEEEINKKLDEKIDEVLEEGLGPGFDEIVKSKVQEKLKEKVAEDVDLKLEEKSEELVRTEERRSEEEKDELKISETASPISKIFSEFKADFHLCWRGSCKTISLVTLLGYIFIAFLLVGCHFSNNCGFASTTISGAVFLALILLVTISLVISIFSKYPRTALVFWMMLDIPLLILVLIFTAQFVALIIIVIIILMRFIQVLRGEY